MLKLSAVRLWRGSRPTVFLCIIYSIENAANFVLWWDF